MKIKKIICLSLSVLIIMAALTSCFKQPTPTPATESTVASTDTAVKTSPAVIEETVAETEPIIENKTIERFADVEALLSEDSTTKTFQTAKQYQEFLHDMGFIEVDIDSYLVGIKNPNDSNDEGFKAFVPVDLTYNNEVFRLNFKYYDDDLQGNVELEDGWALYGIKDATSALNISPFEDQDYGIVNVLNINEEFPNGKDYKNYCMEIYCDMYKLDDNGIPNDFDINISKYYHKTHNLYNTTRTCGNDMIPATPRILCRSYEDEMVLNDPYGDYAYSIFAENYETLAFVFDGMDETFTFDSYMTLYDWVFTKYNTDGWKAINEQTVCSPDGSILIENANQKIIDMSEKNDKGIFIIGITEEE